MTAADRLSTVRKRLDGWSRTYNSVRPTGAGGWFLGIVLGVTLAALNTGNNLIYLVLAALLCLLVLNNVLAEWNLRGLAIARRLPSELFAGHPSTGALQVVNRRRLGDAFAVEVRELDGGGAAAMIDRVPAGGTAESPATFAFGERGVQRFAGVRVGSAYPFGLLRRWRDLDVPGEVLVYPAVERDAPPGAASGEGPGAATRGGTDATGEFLGLRAYQVGDPVRRIHWPISARIGTPMVVVRAGDLGSEVIIEVEPTSTPAARERAIRRACGRVLWHTARGDAVGLEADGDLLPVSAGAAHRRKLLTRLATLRPGGAA